MLAAEEGHTLVMKILLDNHAPVNELDKLKVSAMEQLWRSVLVLFKRS